MYGGTANKPVLSTASLISPFRPSGIKRPHFRWCTHHDVITGDIVEVDAPPPEISSRPETTTSWGWRGEITIGINLIDQRVTPFPFQAQCGSMWVLLDFIVWGLVSWLNRENTNKRLHPLRQYIVHHTACWRTAATMEDDRQAVHWRKLTLGDGMKKKTWSWIQWCGYQSISLNWWGR